MTVKEFLFDSPIYQVVPKDNCEDVINFIKGLGSKEVDGYNPIEKCDSTFVLFCSIYYTVQSGPFGGISHTSYLSGKHETFKTYELILKCKRYGSFLHYLIHVEYAKDDKDNILSISKVGQYPSIADFHIGQVRKYNKILPKDKMREFTKAIGLAANGVGIGSFVYLRRIFEHLVFEALKIAKDRNTKFDIEGFNTARMNKKIQMLSGFLPDFLVENHTIYGILSKGIHELSEEECLKYFTILRESIEMILDEKLEVRQKELKKASIKQTLSQITGQLKK
ncbi:hypothetical protein [uncultured Bacteroides sp.]|jgi:hypothetical protein|uniref:hypothetical protein n=1 Tax=uncultured Bacteroides sp. TaxID=162156 RepID=UPI002599E4FA|nr:hypothetical protein [uncultured Bacteroides sp.]